MTPDEKADSFVLLIVFLLTFVGLVALCLWLPTPPRYKR